MNGFRHFSPLILCSWLAMSGLLFSEESKALVFVPEKINGGTFFVNTKQAYRVVFRNKTGSEIRIQSIESDCDCMQIGVSPGRIEGNGSAVLRLSYFSKKEVSAQVKVRVRYWVEGKCEESILSFEAEVLEGSTARKSPVVPKRISSEFSDEMAPFQITAEEVIGSSNCVMVDVRTSDRFQKVRIPRTLNLPLYAVKTKSILRSHALVLVGNGDLDAALLDEAKTMARAGYQEVKVLHGGIRAWEQAGGALERVQDLNLALVSPSSVPMIEQDPNWKIIEVPDKAPVEAFQWKRDSGVEKVISSAAPGKILLIGSSDQVTRGILESLSGKNQPIVFMVEGGLRAVEKLKHEALLVKGSISVRGFKQIGAIGSGKKGCGSCP